MGILSFEYQGRKHQYVLNKSLMIERGYIKLATDTELHVLKRFAHSILLQIEDQYTNTQGDQDNDRQTSENYGIQ